MECIKIARRPADAEREMLYVETGTLEWQENNRWRCKTQRLNTEYKDFEMS